MLSFCATDDAARYLEGGISAIQRLLTAPRMSLLHFHRSRRSIRLPSLSTANRYASSIRTRARRIGHKVKQRHTRDSAMFVDGVCRCIYVGGVGIQIKDLSGVGRAEGFCNDKGREIYRPWDSSIPLKCCQRR